MGLWKHIKNKRRELAGNRKLIAATNVLGGILIGINISSMSGIITTAQYKCQYNYQGNDPVTGECRGPGPWLQGAIIAAMPGGAWLTAILSMWLRDGSIPKSIVGCSVGFWISGCIFVTFSVSAPILIIGRFFNGISVGICSAQLPVYISDISLPRVRSQLLGMHQWAITWGMVIMFLISYGCSFINHEAAYRLPWGLQLIPTILFLMALLVLPENPRWLAEVDRWQDVREVLTLLHGHGGGRFRTTVVASETRALVEAVRLNKENADASWSDLIKPKMINRTHIGLFAQMWGQLTGMSVMIYYITYVFAMVGLSDLMPSGILFLLYAVMSVPGLVWQDRMGRRPAMLVGAFLMCLFMSLNAGLFAIYSRPVMSGDHFSTSAISMVVGGPQASGIIASTYLFAASYASTWGRATWTYPAELYPPRVRDKAVALSTSANWLLNCALACIAPVAFATITWKTYVIFAVFCASMFIHCFFLFPETANKSAEEVAAIFENDGPGSIEYIGTPAWKTRNDRHAALLRENNVVDL